MSKATSKELDALHALVAQTLAAKLRSGEATAAEISVAVKFLKDNGIEAVVAPSSPMAALTDSLPFAGMQANPAH